VTNAPEGTQPMRFPHHVVSPHLRGRTRRYS